MRKWNEMTKKKLLKNVMKMLKCRGMKTKSQAEKKEERKAMYVITNDEKKNLFHQRGEQKTVREFHFIRGFTRKIPRVSRGLKRSYCALR